MIILIEGVDGSGKSTLCKQLTLEGYILTDVPQGVHQSEEYRGKAVSDNIYICDRSFISDLVYRLEDGKPRRGMDIYSMVKVLSEGVKVIFCHTDTSYEDSMARGEDNITDKSRNLAINHLYNIVYRLLKIFANVPVIDYNWKTDDISDVIKFIERR